MPIQSSVVSPCGFNFRQLFAKYTSLYFRDTGPGHVTWGVGLHAWKTNPGVKDRGRLKTEPATVWDWKEIRNLEDYWELLPRQTKCLLVVAF